MSKNNINSLIFCIFAQINKKMEIEKKLHDEIKEYCKLNGLKMTSFINSLLKNAFMIEKYGETPFSNSVNVVENNKHDDEKPIILRNNVESGENVTENVDNGIKFVEITKTKKRKLN